MTPPPADQIASRLFAGPALRAQPDGRLVRLVRDGYEAAFEEIVRRYGKPLGRYAAAIVGGRSEDVTQDAFSKALLALRREGGEIELRPWLYRIVRNTALNDLRDRPPASAVLAEGVSDGREPSEELERREELAELTARLRALPEPQRAAIVMRELEGLGHEEIAAALGMSGGAARQAIYRARQALRDGLGMLVPLPLLRSMLASGGPGAVETATGAASAAGAGLAFKAGAATMLVASAVGAGVALNGHGAAGAADAAARAAAGGGAKRAAAADPSASAAEAADAGSRSRRDGGPSGAARRAERRENGSAAAHDGGSDGHDGGGSSGSGDGEGRNSGTALSSPSGEEGGGSSGDSGTGDGSGSGSGSGGGSVGSEDGSGGSGDSSEQPSGGDAEPSGTSGDGGSDGGSTPSLEPSASYDMNGTYEESPGDS
jgi:RNA polymerase sigma factor (sigma-70 family)